MSWSFARGVDSIRNGCALPKQPRERGDARPRDGFGPCDDSIPTAIMPGIDDLNNGQKRIRNKVHGHLNCRFVPSSRSKAACGR
eukprot:1211154-Pleurochrysis_carterae.AAC.1